MSKPLVTMSGFRYTTKRGHIPAIALSRTLDIPRRLHILGPLLRHSHNGAGS